MAYIHKRKTGVFVLIDKSIHKWITLGKISATEAKACLRRYEVDSTYLKLDLPLPPSKMTFTELIEEYVAYIKNFKAESTVTCEETALNLISEDFGEVTIDKITLSLINAAVNKPKFKPNTAHYRAKALRNCLKLAVERKYLSKNLVDELKLPPLEQLPPKAVDPVVIEEIFKKLKGPPLTFYKLLYYTGLRPGEAIKLKKADVDLKNRTILVRSTKTKKFRAVPIHPKLAPYLKKFEFFSLRGMNSALRRACADMTTKVSPYVFRHVFATQVLSKTANLRAVQVLLGHSRSTMTERYAHVLDAQLREAVEKL